MGFPGFRRHKSFDRASLLAAADGSAAKGRVRKAIALYRQVLAVEPADHVTHGKVAPLLAKRRKHAEAWASFVAGGEGYIHEEERFDKALSVYRQAARYLPRQLEAWENIARLQCELACPADAVQTLLEGCRHFRGRKRSPQAIRLLRRAREVEPWHFEATFTLARLLAKTGDTPEAVRLLESLAVRTHGWKRRRVRAALFRLAPSVRAAWDWVQAAVAPGGIVPPRLPEWHTPLQATPERSRARVLVLLLALVGTLVMAVPFHVEVGTQTVAFLMGGSGVTVIGLAAFLLFPR